MEVVADDLNDVVANNVGESGSETVNSGDACVANPSEASPAEENAQTISNVVSSSGTPSHEVKPLLPLLVPSLKGKMIYEGGNVTCKGVWGMSDFAHTQPGQVSDFEFKLVKADEGSSLFPVNGRYQGWFHLKQAPPLKGSVKVEDKEMVIQFTKSEDGTHYSINGNGLNKFGSFTLKGTLSEDGDLHVYREYYNLTPAPVNLKRRLSIDGATESAPQPKKKPLVVKTDDVVPPPPADVSPREGTGRVRKQSSLMKEYVDTTVKTPAPTPKPVPAPKVEKEVKAVKIAAAPPAMHRQESTSDRAQRLSHPLKKCAELLKEMAKHPHAIWFLEPVDHVKLNIPDYPLIVTKPMDFSTIRKRVEGNLYDAVDAFAEDMRLVFRNALTFNTARDNVVHIAAREMSSRFEDRFRVLTTQLGGNNAYSAAAILALESAPGPSSGKKSKTPRSSLGGGGGFAKASTSAGPRLSTSTSMPYLPPAVDGSSAHQLLEMQRMMQAMQNEISTLKSQVRENEIVKRLQDSKDASHNPLTFEEKKTLIAQIHKLPADKMPHVLNIIQSALPPRENDEDGDIEVPLDALDTFTLRKLQKFIEDNSEKKKRAPPAAQRHSSASAASARSSFDGNGVPKKARKSASASKISGMSPVNGLDLHNSSELELFESSEDMLFEPDSFEELKAHAQRDAGREQNSNNNMDDDGEEDFSALIGMNQASSSGNDVQLNNLDAWK